MWLERAYKLATLSFDKDVLEIVKKNDPSSREVKGVPDFPYSVMDGIGGDILSYMDLINC